jgi:hypothetical protein
MKGVFLSVMVLPALLFSCLGEGGGAAAAAVFPEDTRYPAGF